jgi:hypothetical protein
MKQFLALVSAETTWLKQGANGMELDESKRVNGGVMACL